MIYDCFTFFNELDLLGTRHTALKDGVDRFVLVETGEVNKDKSKQLYFKESETNFTELRDSWLFGCAAWVSSKLHAIGN